MDISSERTPEFIKFTTSDDAQIAMDVFKASSEQAPIVLMMTPYLRSGNYFGAFPVEELNKIGITCVCADVRGTGESDGPFLGPVAPREIRDGVEVVEWLAAQPFSTGRVGLTGMSYCGANQMLIAAQRPKGLACIAPGVAPMDFYRDWTHRGGIPTHTNWGAVTFLSRNQPPSSLKQALEFYYTVAQSTPLDGDLFRERSAAYCLDQIEVPALFLGGLFDYFGRATYRSFEDINSPKRLVFGPWGHTCPEDATELVNWFKYWLLDQGENPAAGKNVRFYRIGSAKWVTSKGLADITRTRIKLSDAALQLTATGSTGSWSLPDIASPVPFEMDTSTGSGMHLWGETTKIELPLAPGTTIEGLPILHLSITSDDCEDIDVHVRLSIIGDTPVQLTEGRLRLSHFTLDEEKTIYDQCGEIARLVLSHTQTTALVPGHETKVAIELLPTSFTLPEGATLRLGISAVRADRKQAPAAFTLGADSALVLPVVQ